MEGEKTYDDRSVEAEDLIHELRMQVQNQRATQFNSTLLNHLDENPHLTVRQAWEQVEKHFASKGGVTPRSYPFSFDN